MKKILISAYSVSPIRGSECAFGWEITTRLATYFDITVLVCKETPSGAKYYEEIKEYVLKHPVNGTITFIPISMPKSSKKYTLLHDAGFWPAYYWGYNCWQKEAFKKALEMQTNKKFDLVYQLNMIGFREPGYLWKLDVPFIWGPTNGFHSIPFSFINELKGKEWVLQSLKHIFNELQIKTAIRPKLAAKKAELVWCVDKKAFNSLKSWNANAILMQETGLAVTKNNFKNIKLFNNKYPLQLVWSGMITTGKALNILIDSLILIKTLNFKLTVIGDGPLLNDLKKRSQILGDKIHWTGWLSKEQATDIVYHSDLLIHTSLKEGTPHSVLEAIGMGIPVVCHDTCGMSMVVNNKNGYKIPYSSFKYSINYLSNLLVNIIEQPEILNKKYISIWETTELITWDSKVKKIVDSINTIFNKNKNKI